MIIKKVLLILFIISINLNYSYKTFSQTIKSEGSVRAIAIYFKLAKDNFEFGKSVTAGWPHYLQSPKWKGQFLIPTQFDSNTAEIFLEQYPESISSYYYLMSGKKFCLYGDEIEYTGPSLNQGSDSLKFDRWVENNTKIIQWFIDNYNVTNNIDSIDLIILICRTRPVFGFWGLGALPINSVFDKNNSPIKFNGIYQTGCYSLRDTRHIVAHEIGHKLGFWHHLNGLHRWSLMSGDGGYTPEFFGVTMSAYEKNYLGWLEYRFIDTTTYNVRLSNLTYSNKAICIQLENSNKYFVLENRQYSDPFEPDPNKTHDYKCTIPGTGLLIYYGDNWGPNIIPADNQITKVIKYTSPETQIVYNGDNTDLFPNYGRTEIKLYTNSLNIREKKENTHIAIKNIHYENKDIFFDVILNSSDTCRNEIQHPIDFKLNNYPNPFHRNTKIFYRLIHDSHIKLVVYNLMGQEVMRLLNEFQIKSDYEVVLYGHNLPSGIYFYRLITDYGEYKSKMILLKNY